MEFPNIPSESGKRLAAELIAELLISVHKSQLDEAIIDIHNAIKEALSIDYNEFASLIFEAEVKNHIEHLQKENRYVIGINS